MRKPTKFVARGNHHAYYGIALIIFGLFNYWAGIPNYPMNQMLWFWELLTAIGVLLLIDDTIEHTITGNTPLRIIFEKIVMPILKGEVKKEHAEALDEIINGGE